MYTSLPRGVARCQHIKVNGTRCDSPALKGKAYCYFHYRSRLHDAAVSPKADGQEPTPPSQELAARSQELPPAAGIPLNGEFFLLEDANSIQCALQWVLRRILASSIDRRQAALLLYGLQIASANLKKTNFEPYYKRIIRDIPAAEPETAESAETAHEPAKNWPDCHPEGAPLEPTNTHNGCHPELGRGEPIPVRANGPAFSPSEQLTPGAPPQRSAPAQLATDHCPPATADNCQLTTVPTDHPPMASPKRTSRRQRTPAATLDPQMLSRTPRAALSLMFQREVKRHLACLDSPDPET